MMSPEQENKIMQSIHKNEKGEMDRVSEESVNAREVLWAATKDKKSIEKMFGENTTIERANVNVGKALMKNFEALDRAKTELAELHHILQYYYGIARRDMDGEFVVRDEDRADFLNLRESILSVEKYIEMIERDLQEIRKLEEN